MNFSFVFPLSGYMLVPERRENTPQGENMARGFNRIVDKVAASPDVYQPRNETYPRRLADNYSNIKLEFGKAQKVHTT